MYKKVFLDTNPIIYLLENQQPYSLKVRNFLLDCMNSGAEFYTSTITDAEFMVKPLRENRLEDIETYKYFLRNLNVLKCYIRETIAEKAAKIRANYKSVKLGDALQLATSIETNCDAFLTNDSQLKQVIEANVIYLDVL